jgi:hypothetical protein
VSAPAPDAAGHEEAPNDSEPVGSIADEAFKLFRAMTSPTDDEAAGHVCSTSWCPVCQVVGFAREHPDAIASVTQSASALARSLRDLVDTAMAPKPSQEDQ